MKIHHLLSFFILLHAGYGVGQTNFRTGWEAANPVDRVANLPVAEKLTIHRAYLDEATKAGDKRRQLYGYLYLFYDCMQMQAYADAAGHIMRAQTLADQAVDPGWQGWVTHRKAILALRLNKTEEALREYEEAARLCAQAGDSLCLAESLEQVSLMYGKLDDFEKALHYHELALPLIEKYGGEAQLGALLNNYGNINAWQERAAEAVPYLERAIAIYQKLDQPKEASKAMNNLANALRMLRQYDRALELLQECIRINQSNTFQENLRTNYANLSAVYDSLRDYRSANIYLNRYHQLNDSLIGAETQQKIAELEIRYESQQQALELEKSKSALQTTQRSLERLVTFLFLGLLLFATGLWRWRLQIRHAREELTRNREVLADMTQMLLEKNRQLAILKEKDLLDPAGQALPSADTDAEMNLYDQQILTQADWASFKANFEKAYPGYLRRLRTRHPTLTEAEERLFLFLKINILTKEAAAILGISVESVKKTRNRLRKKLELNEAVRLEDYIRNF